MRKFLRLIVLFIIPSLLANSIAAAILPMWQSSNQACTLSIPSEIFAEEAIVEYIVNAWTPFSSKSKHNEVLLRNHEIHQSQKSKSTIPSFKDRPGVFYRILLTATTIGEVVANIYAYEHTPHYNSIAILRQALWAVFSFASIARLLYYFFAGVWLLLDSGQTNNHEVHKYLITENTLPIVTIQVAIRNEPFDVVKMTVDSVLNLNYPSGKLEIQVIDNSDREDQYAEIKEYSAIHKIYFIHRDGTKDFKAGNLNLGMAHARGEYFVILDADSTLEADTLLKVLPEFAKDPKLGYAQFRMHTTNSGANAITRVIAVGMHAYHQIYEILNTQGFIKFDGHNGILRRAALEAVGGWQAEISEDLATSQAIRMAGYTGKYIPYVHTGEWAPTTFQELKKQRRKWANGTTSLLLKNWFKILRSREMKWHEKIDTLYQMSTYLIITISFLTVFMYIPFPVWAALVMVVIPSLPLLLANRNGMLKRTLSTFPLSTIIFSGLLPSQVIGTILAILHRKQGFKVTFKGEILKSKLMDTVRDNGLELIMGGAFFATLPLVLKDSSSFRGLASETFLMLNVLVAPFVVNHLAEINRSYKEDKVYPPRPPSLLQAA